MPGIDHLIRTDFKTVDKRDEVRTVLSWLTGHTDKPPIVTDDERPVGIVNDRALMRRRLDTNARIDRFISTTRAVSPETDYEEVVRRMLEYRASYLPVEDSKGKTAGYVTALDVARELQAGVPVGRCCVAVTKLRTDSTLGDALHAFAQEYVDWLPVVDDNGVVQGVLPRKTLVEMETGAGHDRGRKDAGGDQVRLLEMPVSGHMEIAPNVLGVDVEHEALLESIEEFGYAIVQDRQGRYRGIVTPETILEDAAATTSEGETLPLPAMPSEAHQPPGRRPRRS